MSRPTELPPLLADHCALDLLNTVVQQQGRPVDHLSSDEDAARWLSRVLGHAPPTESNLAAGARTLREALRAAVEARASGDVMDAAPVNALLARMSTHLELRATDGAWEMRRRPDGRGPWPALAPLGEAIADLLVAGDFDLIRQCEHPDCSLWFYDRTKSHRRRWCSMALCGNRHKVSQYRKRRSQ